MCDHAHIQLSNDTIPIFYHRLINISVFGLLFYDKIIFKWDFAAMTGIRLVRCNSADRGNTRR